MAPLGNLVRLLPLNINELPSHPALEALVDSGKVSNVDANSRPDLITFVEEMLNEAASFVDDTLSDTFRKGSSKPSPPSKASVTLLSREIGDAEIQSIPWVNSTVRREFSAVGAKPREVWFARKSRHENLRAKGTADIAEFDYGLRQDHSKHEQEFTPDVFDAYKVLDWDDQIKALAEEGSKIGSHSDVSMSIFEMCHKLPAFLSNRTFPVLVITAKRGQHSMIVTQTPVDISNLTASFYSNARNLKEGDNPLKRKVPVFGIYTSIESCQLLPSREIEWVMATASNAKGWLPMWIQKLGVPSAVVKDVGLFMKWIDKNRQ